MRHLPALLFLIFYCTGCSTGNRDLVIVSKEIRREGLTTSAAGAEYGSAAGAVIENVVVGQIRNTGSEEARNVEVTFRLIGGGHKYTLVARIPSIPAGKAVGFRSEGIRTQYSLQFQEDRDVEIKTGG